MKRILILSGIAVVLLGGGYWLFGRDAATAPGAAGDGGGRFARPPMPVEVDKVGRAVITEEITVVGNLIGAATVEVVPKVSGRLQSVSVRIGDQVRQGQVIAVVEDREIREQVKQAEASFDVARATIRQREADEKFAQTNLERTRSLFQRQLLPRQTLDDAEAQAQAASAQLDLARAQFAQASARLEELRITLANTRITSPVDGFVGRRNLDAGAFVGPNAPVASVVDIRFVRLVVNLVERDLRRVKQGVPAQVEVDAYPGETFTGQVARVAPVLDPQTRTAEMEIEIPNPTYRLKPGMYSRVQLTVDRRENALVVPRNALVDLDGRRGVYLVGDDNQSVTFRPVDVGLQNQQRAEVREGVVEGQRIVTTGAAALRDGDTIVLAGQPGGRGPGDRASRPNGQGASEPAPSTPPSAARGSRS